MEKPEDHRETHPKTKEATKNKKERKKEKGGKRQETPRNPTTKNGEHVPPKRRICDQREQNHQKIKTNLGWDNTKKYNGPDCTKTRMDGTNSKGGEELPRQHKLKGLPRWISHVTTQRGTDAGRRFRY